KSCSCGLLARTERVASLTSSIKEFLEEGLLQTSTRRRRRVRPVDPPMLGKKRTPAPRESRGSAWELCLPLGVERDRRVVGDVDPDVDVREAAVVPDERRPLQPPVVPLAVLAEVAFLVEGQVALVEAAQLAQAFEGLVLVLLAVRLDQGLEYLVQLLL